MSRSIWKGPFVSKGIVKKIGAKRKKKSRNKKVPFLWSRSSTVIPQFVGRNFKIHNGRSFVSLNVTEDMIGHKLGEFVLTRVRPVHKVKSNK